MSLSIATQYTKPVTQSFFLPEMFKQTLLLIRHTQNYFEGRGKEDSYYLERPLQDLYATEMSRVTMRLSCIMAWCLGQQALVQGEIDEDEARRHFRLEGSDICLLHSDDAAAYLPPDMCALMVESEQLYMRAWRLDQQLASEETLH
jgi:hypothetical protein